MENTTQYPYCDTPTSPSTTKPPTVPYNHYHPAQPYRDDPTQPYRDNPTSQPPTPYHDLPPLVSSPTELQPHACDPSLPPQYTDDDVPLALLFHHLEAPPSYAVAIRSSHRDVLIQYIPSRHADADEETGEEERPDDVRFGVERLFAAFIVVALLSVVVVALVWLVVGSGML